MALYKDGNPVSGINSIPRLTLAQYNALNVKPEFWVRTDAPESYKKLSADQVSYDSNTTVKQKIDDNYNNNVKRVYDNVSNTTESFQLNTNYHCYLLTYYAGGATRLLTWIACRSNTDYAIVDIIGQNNITWNNGLITWGTNNYHTTSIVEIS